jgi:hypothetical protein
MLDTVCYYKITYYKQKYITNVGYVTSNKIHLKRQSFLCIYIYIYIYIYLQRFVCGISLATKQITHNSIIPDSISSTELWWTSMEKTHVK